MPNPFEQLRAKAGDGEKSMSWYMKNVSRLARGATSANSLMRKEEIGELTTKLDIGAMYLYFYDPKYKDVLPFYDTFPLVLPFEKAKGGFYGINLHYVPYLARAKILGTLLEYTTNEKLTSDTKIQMSWSLLKSLSNVSAIKPCIKRYLTAHVNSSFMKINPEDWKAAIFLPVEQFKKATKNEVFADSRSKF
jgi:hypothetical protein